MRGRPGLFVRGEIRDPARYHAGMPRLFVAIDLPEALKVRLSGLCCGLPGVRWERDAQFHLTLHFVGEVEGPVARRVTEALHGVRCDPFELSLQGVGHFPPRGAPRILWAGVAASDELVQLHDQVERVLRRAGLPGEERRFFPHVSLGRLSGVPLGRVLGWMEQHLAFLSEPFGVSDVVLFRSRLGAGGAQYSVQSAYPLFARRSS